MTASAPHAALYCRVSGDRQVLGGQILDVRHEAARLGLHIVAEYAERVSASGQDERAEYDRLVHDSANPDRGWDHLLCWSLDRFSREGTFTKATQAILDLERLGIKLHFLKDPALDTPDGGPSFGRDILLALLPVIAAFESRRRTERVRVALREIREGRRQTRSGKPVGREPKLNPELLGAIQRARDVDGLKWSQVAMRLRVPASSARKWYSAAKRASTTLPAEGPRAIIPAGAFGAGGSDISVNPKIEDPPPAGSQGKPSEQGP